MPPKKKTVPQKGVPLVKIKRPNLQKRVYPFDTMQVGEMFFAPDKLASSMSTMAWKAGKQFNRKFGVRSCYMTSTKNGWKMATADTPRAQFGVGVWRVK